VTADESEGSIDERWVCWPEVLRSVRVNTGESSEHVDMRNLDVLEQEEAVIHAVVSKLGSDVSNVDVG
jgi:hypothetical protein